MPATRKKSTATSSKPAVDHNQTSSELVNGFIKSLNVPANIRATPNSSPKKRKPVVVISDDESSGIELVDGPQPSPKKARAATPPPGSEEYQKLPAVSFTSPLKSKAFESGDISFGTNRPSRIKIQTEKGAAYNEEIIAQKLPRKKPTAKPRVKKDSPAKKVTLAKTTGMREETSLLEPSLFPAEQGNAVPPTLSIRSTCEDVFVKTEPVTDDDMPEVSELLLSSPKKKRGQISEPSTPKKFASPADLLDIDAMDEKSDAEQSNSDLDHYLATDDDGPGGYQSDNGPTGDVSDESIAEDMSESGSEGNGNVASTPSTNSNNPDDVTSTVYQEPEMVQFYQGLPYLDAVRPINPYRVLPGKPVRMSVPRVASTLKETYADSMMKGILFTQSGFYVNFSRIHPKLLREEKSRIRMANNGAAAVGLYTGICTRGAILNSDDSGPPLSQYKVHGVTVAGTTQDNRRFTALIGSVLGYKEITGNQSLFGVSFYTRGEGKTPNFPSSIVPSLADLSGISSLFASDEMPGSSTTMRSYPMARAYEDRIPVYDGRECQGRKFNFTDANFRDLESWPLYRKGKHEIEVGTIVSVGHTVSTYTGGGGGLFLSTNIHFVIVLGKPVITLRETS